MSRVSTRKQIRLSKTGVKTRVQQKETDLKPYFAIIAPLDNLYKLRSASFSARKPIREGFRGEIVVTPFFAIEELPLEPAPAPTPATPARGRRQVRICRDVRQAG